MSRSAIVNEAQTLPIRSMLIAHGRGENFQVCLEPGAL
jgi:hypothetical protein